MYKTSLDKLRDKKTPSNVLNRIKKLEDQASDHARAIDACLDLIKGMDEYVEHDLKISTPEKIQKRWETRRDQLLRDAGVSLGKSKKKSKKSKKAKKGRTKKSTRRKSTR